MKLVVAAFWLPDNADPKAVGKALSAFRAPNTFGEMKLYDPATDPGVGPALYNIGLSSSEKSWNAARAKQAERELT